MQVQCESCGREHALDECSVRDGELGLVCTQCGHWTAIGPVPTVKRTEPELEGSLSGTPLTLNTKGEDSPESPSNTCPKCHWTNPVGAESCHRCGLHFERMNPRLLRAWNDPLSEHEHGAMIKQQWKAIEGDLSQSEAHLAFIALCAEHQALNFAGQCYRRILDQNPDCEHADAYRQKVLSAALAHAGHLEDRLSKAVETGRRGLGTLLVGMTIFLLFALAFYWLSRNQAAWHFGG